MKKVLFYGMTGEKMCFQHIFLNALDLVSAGAEVKIIFEGPSVKLVSVFEEEKNQLYQRVKDQGLIAGVCLVCSKMMNVYEVNKSAGLTMLDDMSGHAGMRSYIEDGYTVVSM
ncbi:MAG: hypothetical protein ACOX2U_02410 [Limisphaerales bacterium]|jgi:hypothetical protein|nr:hypothetical protein [Verrucomicrobiota bacterium]